MICTWDTPGVDRYTGTVKQAIVAYGLPLHTQSELIKNFEQRRFADQVVIDRETIRGKHDYEPTIRSMHFGSKGKFCDPTRLAWDDAHVETALVVCTADGTECIAWPAVCGNVFRITRLAAPQPQTSIENRPEEPGVDSAGTEPVVVAEAPEGPYDHSNGGSGPWTTHPWPPSSSSHVYTPPCVVPSIPEPSTVGLFGAGLIALAYRVRMRKSKK